MNESFALGVDIGGSHITAGVVDLLQRKLLEETIRRRKVSAHESTDHIINAWAEVITESIQASHLPIARIGMALPGPFDYENGISYIKGLDKYEALYGKNVKYLLGDTLGISPSCIQMKNDAGCFLQGEIFGGIAMGESRCIGLTIGTGIGTAKTVNGAGEDADLWHSPLNDSIAENYLSSRWFVKRYKTLYDADTKDVKELCERIAVEPRIHNLFQEFAENLASFLIKFIQQEQPDLIVLGGNIAHADQYYLPSVIRQLQKNNIHVPIKKSLLGEHATLLGSACLWSTEPKFTNA
jgi:glucokinase